MRLKGKAEKDFFSWYYRGAKFTDEDRDIFYQDGIPSCYGFILEWFDINEIYLSVQKTIHFKMWVTIPFDGNRYATRNEAITGVIEHGNNIYNGNNI